MGLLFATEFLVGLLAAAGGTGAGQGTVGGVFPTAHLSSR